MGGGDHNAVFLRFQPIVSSAFVVGLTGGIGAGKSTVCREFECLAVPIIDADIAAREVVIPGSEGLGEVVSAFGREILSIDGSIDRGKLRHRIFENDGDRTRIEAILHPRIRERIGDQLAAVTSPYCILCIPLLVEKGGYENVDHILMIDCPTEVQIARVMERDNLTRLQVEAIMRSQASREERLRLADDVIDNSARVEALRAQVEALHVVYTQIADKLKLERQSNAEHRKRSAE